MTESTVETREVARAEQVRVGNKDIRQETETIPYKTRYQADDSKSFGHRETLQKGEEGLRTITFTNGLGDGGIETKPAKEEIILVGTRPQSVEKVIPFQIIEKEDTNLTAGQRQVEETGRDGRETTITTYLLDPLTGQITENQQLKLNRQDPVNQLVRVGTKVTDPVTSQAPVEEVTTEEPVPFETKLLPSENVKKGDRLVVISGQFGRKLVTRRNGEIIRETIITPPVAEEIHIAAQDVAALPTAPSGQIPASQPAQVVATIANVSVPVASQVEATAQPLGQGDGRLAQEASTRTLDSTTNTNQNSVTESSLANSKQVGNSLPQTGTDSGLLALYGSLLLSGLGLSKFRKSKKA